MGMLAFSFAAAREREKLAECVSHRFSNKSRRRCVNMSTYNDIGIDSTLDWERIAKLLRIGLFAGMRDFVILEFTD